MKEMKEQIIEYLEHQRNEWLDLLNKNYKTDLGKPITEYVEGRLTAYIEMIEWIENKDKNNGRFK